MTFEHRTPNMLTLQKTGLYRKKAVRNFRAFRYQIDIQAYPLEADWQVATIKKNGKTPPTSLSNIIIPPC